MLYSTLCFSKTPDLIDFGGAVGRIVQNSTECFSKRPDMTDFWVAVGLIVQYSTVQNVSVRDLT